MSIFENAVTKAKQLAGVASRKTGNAVELSRLKLQAVQISSMMQSTYERIGTLIYEQEKTGTDNQEIVAVCIREVDGLLTSLGDVNEKIARYKNGVLCTRCRTTNLAGAVYCQNCGANLAKQSESK